MGYLGAVQRGDTVGSMDYVRKKIKIKKRMGLESCRAEEGISPVRSGCFWEVGLRRSVI